MSKKRKGSRQFTVEEKLRIIEEARQPNTTVAEVLRRHQVDPTTFYRWEKQAKEGMREALTGRARRNGKGMEREIERLEAELDVAYVSPSSVYRVLSDADLLYRWKRSRRSGQPPPEPEGPNERWHVDLMYLRVEDTWYFLVTVLDAYSRYVVHWDLLTTMTAAAVRVVIQDALKKTGANPEVVTDNGSQFTAKDFKELVRDFELEHIRIRTYHPESNGKIERYHRSTRDALDEEDLRNLARAREIIGRWVEFYNTERLHASLHYLPPAEYWAGQPEARIGERKEKLERGRKRREIINRERLQEAA